MSDLPGRFIPDEERTIELRCATCEERIGSRHRNCARDAGAWHHRSCLYEQHPDFEQADRYRQCYCGYWTKWRYESFEQEYRVCPWCNRKFHGPTPAEYDGLEPHPPSGGDAE